MAQSRVLFCKALVSLRCIKATKLAPNPFLLKKGKHRLKNIWGEMFVCKGRRGLLAAFVLDLVPVAANRSLLPIRKMQGFTDYL